MSFFTGLISKLRGNRNHEHITPPPQATATPTDTVSHKPRHEKATKRGAQRGAFGCGCNGPFDPRPALKPSEMRERYGDGTAARSY